MSLKAGPACQECGSPSTGSPFCVDCGAPNQRVCGSCGATCGAAARFCGQCGEQFAAVPAPAKTPLRRLSGAEIPSYRVAVNPSTQNGQPAGPGVNPTLDAQAPPDQKNQSGIAASFFHALLGFLAVGIGFALLTLSLDHAVRAKPEQSALINIIGLLVSATVVCVSAWWIGRQSNVALGIVTLLMFIAAMPAYIYRQKRNRRLGREGRSLAPYPSVTVGCIITAFAIVISVMTGVFSNAATVGADSPPTTSTRAKTSNSTGSSTTKPTQSPKPKKKSTPKPTSVPKKKSDTGF